MAESAYLIDLSGLELSRKHTDKESTVRTEPILSQLRLSLIPLPLQTKCHDLWDLWVLYVSFECPGWHLDLCQFRTSCMALSEHCMVWKHSQKAQNRLCTFASTLTTHLPMNLAPPSDSTSANIVALARGAFDCLLWFHLKNMKPAAKRVFVTSPNHARQPNSASLS